MSNTIDPELFQMVVQQQAAISALVAQRLGVVVPTTIPAKPAKASKAKRDMTRPAHIEPEAGCATDGCVRPVSPGAQAAGYTTCRKCRKVEQAVDAQAVRETTKRKDKAKAARKASAQVLVDVPVSRSEKFIAEVQTKPKPEGRPAQHRCSGCNLFMPKTRVEIGVCEKCDVEVDEVTAARLRLIGKGMTEVAVYGLDDDKVLAIEAIVYGAPEPIEAEVKADKPAKPAKKAKKAKGNTPITSEARIESLEAKLKANGTHISQHRG